MRKRIFLYAILFISILPAFGQSTFKITKEDTDEIFTTAKDNETVIQVFSNIPLSFTSNMQKNIQPYYDTIENGWYEYRLIHTVNRRNYSINLTVESFGYPKQIQALMLNAKVSVKLNVYDHESDILMRYREHVRKGDSFFQISQYDSAKKEYNEAWILNPNTNDLSKGIKDAEFRINVRMRANEYYEAGRYVEAKQEYESLVNLNPNDTFAKKNINLCNERIRKQEDDDKEKKRVQKNTERLLGSLSTIQFESSGGKKTFSTNDHETPWDISNVPSWCSIQKKDNSLILICEQNTSTNMREGGFEINAGGQSKTVLIRQNKWELFFELSDNLIKFGKSGGKYNLSVHTNTSSWSILSEIAWCSTTQSDSSIFVSCEANPTNRERSATFHVIANNESKEVRITQVDITNLEKGHWKQAIRNVASFGVYPILGGLFKGYPNGLGVKVFLKKNVSYWGEFQKEGINGKGIYIIGNDEDSVPGCSDCKYYVGNWSLGEKNGKGKCYDKTGELLYDNFFFNNIPYEEYPQSYNTSHKFECIEYENGDIYLGETLKGVRDGLGIFVWANGDVWYGEWKNDKGNGDGIEYQYSGNYKISKWAGVNNVPKQSYSDSKPASVSNLRLEPKGSNIYKNSIKLSNDEIRELMANTDELLLYDKGILYNKKGNTLLIAGGCMFFTGLVVGKPISSYTNAETAGNAITGIGVGIGAAAILSGVALKLIGVKKIEESVNMYNKRAKIARTELRCNFTGNGIHLTLGF